MKERFTDEQIIGFLREADADVAVKELCRRHGRSDAKHLKVLESENARLKKRLAESIAGRGGHPRMKFMGKDDLRRARFIAPLTA